MPPVTHQTIKLSKGKHASPDDGACVMELASMLAGEPFSDHPASVCPVIGSFLRAYNDSIDDERRQDLYAYAATVVGSRGSIGLQRERADCLAEWAFEIQRRQWTSRYLPMVRLRTASLRRQPSAHAVGTLQFGQSQAQRRDPCRGAGAARRVDRHGCAASAEKRSQRAAAERALPGRLARPPAGGQARLPSLGKSCRTAG